MKKMVLLLFLISFQGLARAGDPVQIFVSIEPHRYLAEQIGGDQVQTGVMVPPGKSPATYSPTPSQLTELGRSVAYFRAGVPFEESFMKQVHQFAPGVTVLDLNRGIALRHIEEAGDHHDDHDHGHFDPHVWMNPLLLAEQGENMAAALSKLDAEHAKAYVQRQQAFSARMEKLDARVRELLTGCAGKTIFVYHPAFGYFTDAYGLKQVAVEQGGKSPSPRHTAELIRKAREDEVKVIFVQPQFNQQKAAVIAEAIEGRVEPLNPLAEDVPANIEHTAAVIHSALTESDL